jgi:hypothetical protein
MSDGTHVLRARALAQPPTEGQTTKTLTRGGAGRADSATGHPWVAVLKAVASDRVDRVTFLIVTLVVGTGDSVLLPYDFTQQLSFANWRYFGPRYAVFTVAFALAMAWVVTLQVHAMRAVISNARAKASGNGGALGALAAVVGLLPSLLCCSPIVPTFVSFLGLSATAQLRTTGSIMYFFATKQDLLLAGSLILVVGSGFWSLRKLARATCLSGQCATEVADEVADEACCDSNDGSWAPLEHGGSPTSRG